jgi:hypothetical protein
MTTKTRATDRGTLGGERETIAPSEVGSISDVLDAKPVEAAVVIEQVSDKPAEELITCERFARTVKDRELRDAFVHVEKLSPRSRRQTKSAWQAEYDAWLVKPR